MWETWVGKIPWRRELLLTPLFWPGEFHGLYSLWGCKSRTRHSWKVSDFHFSLLVEASPDIITFIRGVRFRSREVRGGDKRVGVRKL